MTLLAGYEQLTYCVYSDIYSFIIPNCFLLLLDLLGIADPVLISMFGFIVYYRAPKIWTPKLRAQVLYSEILDTYMSITVTLHALKLIDDVYGLDNYILRVIRSATLTLIFNWLLFVNL